MSAPLSPDHNYLHCDFEAGDRPCAVSIDDFDKPFILYPARKKAVRDLQLTFKIMIPFLCIYFAICSQLGHIHWSLLCAYAILLAAVYVWRHRKHTRTILPVLALTEAGLEMHTLHVDLFIPWSEIKEARSFRIVVPYLGIVPYSLTKTLARGNVCTQAVGWMNALVAPFYLAVGLFVAPIFILESELPMTASEVAEYINLRKEHAARRLNSSV